MRENRIEALLSADSNVTALVSDRIYPDIGKRGAAAPYIVYKLVGGNADTLLEGGRSFDALRVQVDCYATTKDGAIDLGLLCATAIETMGYLIGPNPSARDSASNLFKDSADYGLIENN